MDLAVSNVSWMVGAFALSLIPILIWLVIFFKKDKVSKWLAFETLAIAALLVGPVFGYIEYIFENNPGYNIFTLISSEGASPIPGITPWHAALGVFVVVAIFEEVFKHLIVRFVDERRSRIKSIDDAIEYSVISALGFSLAENTLYFVALMHAYTANTIDLHAFLLTFVIRATVVTFVHILCSGIYGYHVGISRFAAEEMVEEENHGHRFLFTRFFRAVFPFIRLEKIFAEEHRAEGLLLAVTIHALFNLMTNIPGVFAFTIPLLAIGYWYLNYEMSRGANRHRWTIEEEQLAENKIEHDLGVN